MFWPLFRYIGGVNQGPQLQYMDPLEEPSIYPRSSAYILDPGEYKPLTTGNVKIEMTKGVTTKHILEKKDKYGEIELQEMCFYLENKFQVIILRKFMMTILIRGYFSGDLGWQ